MPDNIVFPECTLSGAGTALNLIRECARFGTRGVIMHGQSLAKSGGLKSILNNIPDGIDVACWEHGGGEPTLAHLEEALGFAKEHKAEWIVGVGGGSVLDLAKACAGLFNAKNGIVTYHDGAPIETLGVPFIAAPTTAGTGSEATINSVLTNTATRQKKSIRSPFLIAKIVILDPVLLANCPKKTIAYAGLDALTQAVEAYTSRMATWLSDQLGLKAIILVAANLETVYRGGGDEERLNLLIGSYLAGLSFSMARLGVVHGLAHPLGVRYHAAHGLVCGVCLPHAVELNRPAMGDKYEIISREIGGDLLTLTRQLPGRLGVESPFKGQEIIEKEIIIRETLKSWSTSANAKPVTEADVEFLLARLFEN
jgi:alcohol dehydrogenase class IV